MVMMIRWMYSFSHSLFSSVSKGEPWHWLWVFALVGSKDLGCFMWSLYFVMSLSPMMLKSLILQHNGHLHWGFGCETCSCRKVLTCPVLPVSLSSFLLNTAMKTCSEITFWLQEKLWHLNKIRTWHAISVKNHFPKTALWESEPSQNLLFPPHGNREASA